VYVYLYTHARARARARANGPDMSLVQPGRKQSTAIILRIYSKFSPRSSLLGWSPLTHQFLTFN